MMVLFIIQVIVENGSKAGFQVIMEARNLILKVFFHFVMISFCCLHIKCKTSQTGDPAFPNIYNFQQLSYLITVFETCGTQ